MKKSSCYAIILLIISFSLAQFNKATASPIGQDYNVILSDGPLRTGFGFRTFGSPATTLSGLSIQESVISVSPEEELLIFHFESNDGFPLHPFTSTGGVIITTDLTWGNNMTGNVIPESIFLYYSKNGVPAEMNPILDVSVGPHPTEPDIEVFFPGFPDDQELAESTFVIAPELLISRARTPNDLFEFLGVGPASEIDGIHFGYMVTHVPEPSSFALAVLSLLGLVAKIRRRMNIP